MARKAEEKWRKAAERKAAERFGDWIAERRGSNLTQKQLAEQAGLSAALVSNVESGRRRATDSYLKSISVALKHDPGDWHLRRIRDKAHDEVLLEAVREQRRILHAQPEGIGDNPQSQALFSEQLSLAINIDEFSHVMQQYMAAYGRGEDFDPEAARRAAAQNRPGRLEREVLAEESLRSHHQSGPEECTSSPSKDDSESDRPTLVDELLREVEHLSAAQLHRVLGFVAALPRANQAMQQKN